MRWTESIDINAAAADVRAAIADEHRLMAWSAWPEATGFRCAVEVGDGRETGSVMVFRDDAGSERGRQTLTRVAEDRIEYQLFNRAPFGRIIQPELTFHVEPLGAERTRVLLGFRATLPLPPVLRQVVDAVMGARVRRLHVEDLRLLKKHVEQA